MSPSFNDVIALILGSVAIVGFGLWAWYLTKKHNKPIGEILATLAVKGSESYFVVFVILIFVMEALVAATLTPPGENAPNPLARWGSHMLISMGGAIASVTFTRDVAAIFEKGIDGVDRFVRFCIVFIVFGLAFGIPIGNIMLIAAGAGEDLQLQLYSYANNPFVSNEEWQQALSFYELPHNYSAWGGMSYILKTTVILTGIHVTVSILEALRNMSSKERRGMIFGTKEQEKEREKKEEDKKDEKKDDKKEDKKEEPLEVNLKHLLRRMGYDEKDELDKMIKLASTKLYSIKDRDLQAHMAIRLGKLVNESRDIDDISDDNKKQREKGALRKRIREFFSNSPKESDKNEMGLGISLKGSAGKA